MRILHKDLRKKILFSAICFLLVLILNEAILWFVFFKTPILMKQNIGNNSWYRIELMREIEKRKQLSLAESSLHGVYNPLRGWALKPNINEPQILGKFTLRTNSRGVRGDEEYPYDKNSSKKRILMFGDSFTCGDEVSNKETYPYYLQEMLPNAEVLNFGVNGYGHDQMLLYLKEEGVKYKPDVIILGFVAENMKRNLLNIRRYPKPRFELVQGKLKLTNVPVPLIESLYVKEIYRLKIVDLFEMLYEKFILKKAKERLMREQITTAILDDMIKVSTEIGSKPIIVYVWTPEGIPLMQKRKKYHWEQYLLNYCQDREVSCVSTRQYFTDAVNKGVSLKEKGHWDAEGNKIVARVIKDYLIKEKIVNN